MLFTRARIDSKGGVIRQRWLSQRQLRMKNAHCKQSPAIAMVLKGLTCYHMIVITYGEGEAEKQEETQ